ncbi:hypothetical protein LAZ67_4002195 [Cordylochernes scorpioides]|uniref:Uncharacterized protein n=1 Tax=Cordylochernes scorpioides TaxID=51811 RepID=A0ABY6KCK9_9ARAC|nr:hypothetical protein LAZ67_4002195 [Cordylochernes scorpioides]
MCPVPADALVARRFAGTGVASSRTGLESLSAGYLVDRQDVACGAKGLKKMLMLEKNEERKTCTMSWLERVKKATGRSLEDLQVMVTDRSNWRIFVHIVAKSQTGLEGH